jgi:dienelactone hydrolase
MEASTLLEGFSVAPFSFENTTRDVYRRGEGPGVVIMHEVPGMTPEVLSFARVVVEHGFTVFLPSLFGSPGRPLSTSYALSQLAHTCVSSEFRVFAAGETSPIVAWLRALCQQAHAELGGRGVGAIGMCLTGNFALSLMVLPSMMAPVLAQPSLPIGFSKRAKAGLHVAPADLAAAQTRAKEGVPLLGLRFTHDPLCPKERFQRLRDEFGDAFEAVEIDSGPGNAAGIGRRAHSVLTNDFVDAAGHPTRIALDRVLGFLREQLAPGEA